MRFANISFPIFLGVICLTACTKQEDSTVAPPPPAPTNASVVLNSAPLPSPPPETVPPPASAQVSPSAVPPAPVADPKEFKDIDGKTISLLEYVESLASGYERTRASQSDGTPWPPLTDLNQLVTYRMVSRLPAAPAGQKFVYDPQTGKVSLVAQ